MLSQCQQSIDDKDNVWAFMLRQIVDVFVIMAYDKLKARLDDLAVITAAQCEAIVIYSAHQGRSVQYTLQSVYWS